MNTALSTNSRSRNSLNSQLVSGIFIAAFASVLSIFLHESAHFLTAKMVGASGVTFHWAYVDHDLASVSNFSNALIALFGPLFNHLLVAAIWWHTRSKNSSMFMLALGFSAALRSVAVLPFTIKTLLGRDTTTFFFDEVRGANALGISPLIPVAISLIVFFVGTAYFGRKAKRDNGLAFMLVMLVGIFAGICAWGIVGPMLFPGGHGFN